MAPQSLFLVTFLGAAVSYLLQKSRRRVPMSVLQAINIEVGEEAHPAVIVVDLVVTSLVGTLVAFFFSEPTTNQQALMAGWGAIGLIAVLDRGSGEAIK